MAIWLLTGEVALTAILGTIFWLSLFAKIPGRAIYLLLGILLWLVGAGTSVALAVFCFMVRSRGSSVAYFPQAALLASSAFMRNMRGEESLILGTLLNFGDGKIGLESDAKSRKVAELYRIFWLRPDVEIARACMSQERDWIEGATVSPNFRRRSDGSLLLQITITSYGRARDANLDTLSSVRQAHIAMAITRYRLKHGTSPSQLQVLVPDELPAIPLDPFDGQPMKYRVEAGDAIVYSIGKNRVDDGGQLDREKDHGFRLSPLAKGK